MYGSYEEEYWFDFKSYGDAFNHLIHTILKDIPIDELESNEVPEYMIDTVYSITIKGCNKMDRGRDYYIIQKEDNEITNIYAGE